MSLQVSNSFYYIKLLLSYLIGHEVANIKEKVFNIILLRVKRVKVNCYSFFLIYVTHFDLIYFLRKKWEISKIMYKIILNNIWMATNH